jgi:AcrR family transcriptional regulator
MSPDDRREQRRQHTHQQLIDAAKQVFSEKGFADASILDITEAANVSKRTFYLHFADREALIEEIALQSLEEVRQQIEQETMQYMDDPMPNNFYRVVRAIFDYAQANPHLMQIIFGRNGSIRLNAITREYMVQAMSINMNDPRCKFVGREDAAPQELIASAKAGMIFQMVSWWVQNNAPLTPSQMAETAVHILFEGVRDYFEEKEPVA